MSIERASAGHQQFGQAAKPGFPGGDYVAADPHRPNQGNCGVSNDRVIGGGQFPQAREAAMQAAGECSTLYDRTAAKESVLGAVAPSALDVQIGGNHYKNKGIQPVVYSHSNNLNFLEGCIVKRITRWRDKGGFDDLHKIKHEVDLLIELESNSIMNQSTQR